MVKLVMNHNGEIGSYFKVEKHQASKINSPPWRRSNIKSGWVLDAF
jgi:hypothetical protein